MQFTEKLRQLDDERSRCKKFGEHAMVGQVEREQQTLLWHNRAAVLEVIDKAEALIALGPDAVTVMRLKEALSNLDAGAR